MRSKNTQRSTTLYKTLRPKQLAALMMEAVADGNANECERISDNVERRTYTEPHAVFTDWHHAMGRIGLLVAGEFWRQQYLQSVGVADLIRLRRDMPDGPDTITAEAIAAHCEEEDQIVEQLTERLMTIRGMLKALETVCTENGFSYQAVISSSTPANIASIPLEPFSQSAHDEWADCFRGLLPEYQPHQNIHDTPPAA